MKMKYSIEFAIFQGTDKLVFKDRKELTGFLFEQLTEAYKTIDFYSDRLEIISLGGLVPGLSLAAAMLGASQPRNEKLAEAE